LNQTNQIDQIDQIIQMDQINQADRASPNLAVPNWFFHSPLVVDISKRCAVLERRLGVRG